MDRLIKLSDAIEAVWKPQVKPNELIFDALKQAIESEIRNCPTADRLQGDVDAVAIFEREMHNLEQGYITIGEFDERIEPLRHLCYGRPQGRWIFDRYDTQGINRCSECGAEIKGYGKNIPFPNCPYCLARMESKTIGETRRFDDGK